MPDPLRLLLAILATYRLARLVALEEGPGGLLTALRARLGAYDYGPDGEPASNLGRGVSCPLCVGVWAAAACVVLALLNQSLATAILLWLGVAGGQTALERLTR